MIPDPKKTKVLITGGTGLVGRKLSSLLTTKGYTVIHLSRKKSPDETYKTFIWNPSDAYIEEGAFNGVEYILHLAGAGVADKRWTNKRKEELYTSRIEAADLIFNTLKSRKQQISAFISASAIGIYGYNSGASLMTEVMKARKVDFLSDLVTEWEAASDQFKEIGSRVVKFRIGLVLSRDGGLLAKLLPFVKSGLAATFGDGRQFMSWVHIDDLTSLFVESLENHMLNGTYNAVSPNPVTNKVFLRALCKMLNRPLIMPGIPKFLLYMGLGEMANAIAGGNNVSCKKIMDTGFRFAFPELEPALRNLLNQ